MSKYRVYELAKEFAVKNQIIIETLTKHDYTIKTHLSVVDDKARTILQQELSKVAQKPPQKEKKTAPPREQNSIAKKEIPLTKPQAPKQAPKERKEENPGQKVAHNHHQEQSKKAASSHTNTREQGGKNFAQKKHSPKDQRNNEHSQKNHFQKQHNEKRDNLDSKTPKHRENAQITQEKNMQNSQNNHRKTDRNRDTHEEHNFRQGKNAYARHEGNRNNQGSNFNNRRNKNNKFNKNRKNQPPVQVKVEIARPKHIKLAETIAVKDLASKMSYPATEVMKKLLLMGVMANINQEIDFDTATLVASEFGVTTEVLPPEVDPTEIPEIEDDEKNLIVRPPVVTVMGHVDHGKTSLLDVIRKSSVSMHEAGGITQRIGAYQVVSNGKKIVFLDTPGHEAFTAMRARGTQVTDIAILVVAADDGVMPQTIEAIDHAKSAHVPIIVAINKIDKPGANPDHVIKQLSELGLIPEEWGGDTIMVRVSAKKDIGISELLEMVLLVAEVEELKANPNRDARGVIIEAQLDKGRGAVATVLVQNGTLHIGDAIIAGTTYGKVRAMINDRGENVKKAPPSTPVEVLGLSGVPEAGDFLAVLDEKKARSIAERRIEKQRTDLIKTKKVSLDDLFLQIQNGQIKDLNILLKADVQGSLEALSTSLLKLNENDEVRVSIIHSGVGAVSESDVMLASASNALIIAFNVRPDAKARHLADTEHIDIRTYQVIYDALNDVKDAMSGMLAPKYKEVIQGKVEIRKVMNFSKALVAGSYVLEGKILNNSKIRILRDNIIVFDGEIDSLRRFKDDVKEVVAGYECGITIKDYRDFREGDIIEAYNMEEVAVSITEANALAAKRRAEAKVLAMKKEKEEENKQ